MKNTGLVKLAFFSVCISLFAFVPPKKKKKRTAKKSVAAKMVHKPAEEDSLENPYYIIVDKRHYDLIVYDDLGWSATYPVVFG